MLFSCKPRRMTVPAVTAVLLYAFAAVPMVHAADSPLTLETAVQRGVAQAPLIVAREADATAMREEAQRAGRLPDPSLTFGIANFPVTAPGAFSLYSDPMTMRTVGVMQAIPSRAARTADRALASAQIDVAEADRVMTEQTVRERAADAWITLWGAQQQQNLLGELRDEAALTVKIAQARLRGGDGSVTDALATRAEAGSLDNRLETSAAAIEAAQASLVRWTTAPATTLADPPDFAHLPTDPNRLDRAIDEQAPMRVWAARDQAAQAALDKARAAKHPDWTVEASYGHRVPGLSDTVILQFGVSLPLFTHNRQDRGISAKQAQSDAALAAHEDARRAQREAVAQTVAKWEGLGRQVERDGITLLPLARDRAATALAGYRGGGSLQPWLDARRDEIELRLRYVEALEARAQLWASLAYLLPSEVTP